MRRRFVVSSACLLSRALAVAVGTIVAFGLIHPIDAAAETAPPPVSPAQTRSETGAVAEAHRTGRPVEVTDRTTETTQILANPNGSFTLRSNVRPVRVKRNDAWVPIDPTLRRNADGSLTPTATAQDVTFSGGGNAPLITLRHNGKALAFGWPEALPAPVMAGDTATYPAVFPGVDLRITAQSDGYSQVLVVRDATAAANPALAHLRLSVTGTGLNLTVGSDGSLSGADPNGAEVFHGSTPVMWDSRLDDRTGPPPTATDHGSGRVTPLAVAAAPRAAARTATGTSTTDLTLTPDSAALTGKDVVYPLYVDPSMGVHRTHWTEVTDNGWHYFDDPNQIAQVGFCSGWSGCGTPAWRARSYFQMDISALWPRNGFYPAIYRAQFFANQVWSADHNCGGGQPTNVYESGGIDGGTRWPGPAGLFLNTQWSNAGGPCAANNLVFDVWTGVRHASDGSWASLVLGLVAGNENEPLQWKKFDNNPLLEADFSFPPNPATALRVSNEIRCNGKVVTPDAQPVLYSTATDNNNPPLNLALAHEVWDSSGSTKKASTGDPSLDVIGSGGTGQWQIPRIGDGDFSFRTAVYNLWPGGPNRLPNANTNRNLWSGPWSNWYPFTIDATPLSAAPAISSADYPPDYWGAPAGAPGAIQVSTGEADIVGYTYTFTGSGTEVIPNSGDCNYHRKSGISGGWIPHGEIGPDWIPVPAGLTPGRHTMHVKSFDRAHNVSPESAYTFYVAAGNIQPAQRFEAESMTRSQPAGQNRQLAPANDCCDISWSGGAELGFWGNAAGQSFTLNFPTTQDSTYSMAIGLTKSSEQGRLEFRIDGQLIGNQVPGQVAGSFDAYNSRPISSYHPLGIRRLAAGTHTLTVTVAGTNPSSNGIRYGASIDFLDLVQTTRFEAEDAAQVSWSQPPGQNISLVPQTNCCWTVNWSNGTQLGFWADRPNTWFDVTFQVPIEADYALGANMSKANDYGQVTFLLDDRPLRKGDSWDGYQPTGVGSEFVPLGGDHLAAGSHKLTIKLVGTNQASIGTRHVAGIDYLSAVPVNNVTQASFTAAMNNDGIGSDHTSGSTLDLGDTSLSAQTLAAAGYAPGSAVTVNGATFTMPAARADGADNVIVIGQTIPFPTGQQVKAAGVGLLVASTCGTSPATRATITYTDASTQDTPMPAVEDWIGMRPELASFVLPYRNQPDGTADAAKRPRILALFVPADPTKVLKSITLPHYGTSLLPSSCAPALHVLAIAPRPGVIPSGPGTPAWVGSWTSIADTAKAPAGGAGFANQTVRVVTHPSVPGDQVRVRLTNPTNAPVRFDTVTLAAQAGTGAGALTTPIPVTFAGATALTLPAGGEAQSDPVTFPVTTNGSGNLLISLHLPAAVTDAPIHATPNAPAYLASGNTAADIAGTAFTTALDGIPYVSGLAVSTPDTTLGTVAVLGDQFSAVAPPGSGYRPTWVDDLPAKLADAGISLPGGLVNASHSGLPPIARWRLDDGSGSTARDTAGTFTGTLNGGATWSGDHGGAISFDGTGSVTTGSAVVATGSSSYTLSAWVKLTATGPAAQTVVSQDASQNSAFALQYTGSTENKWSFTLPVSNTAGAATVRVLSQGTAQLGTWTHLLAVYNASSRAAEFYVNGTFQGWASPAAPFASGGPFAIGRGKIGDFLTGSVSDVRVYPSAATGFDASILATGDPSGIGAPTAADADRTLDQTVRNQPALRTVIVALGANDLLAGRGKDSVKQELTELMSATSPTGIRNYHRTDGTGDLLHVILTTVPPLNLPDSDPREQQRRLLNADLLANFGNYGADELVDLESAVRDPAHPNQINPNYLTGGAPNPAYHDAVAQSITDAATRFPPEAKL